MSKKIELRIENAINELVRKKCLVEKKTRKEVRLNKNFLNKVGDNLPIAKKLKEIDIQSAIALAIIEKEPIHKKYLIDQVIIVYKGWLYQLKNTSWSSWAW